MATYFDIVKASYSGSIKGNSVSGIAYKKASEYASIQANRAWGFMTPWDLNHLVFDSYGLCTKGSGTTSTQWKYHVGESLIASYPNIAWYDLEGVLELVVNGGANYTHRVNLVKGDAESVGGSTTCTYHESSAKGSNSWTYTASEKSGNYAFKNFTNASGFSVSGRNVTIPYSAQDVTVYANYVPMFNVKFSANDGSTNTSTQSGIVTESNAKLNANIFTRNGYTFVGWSLSADATTADFADKSSADAVFEAAGASAGDTIALYAVWVSIRLRKRGTGADAETNVNAIGSLYLLSSEDGYEAHIDPTNGATGEWLFAPKPNVTYRVGCTMLTTDPDRFWTFSGVTDTQSQSVTDIAIGPTLSNVVLNANFTRKTTKLVTTDKRAEANSIRPEEMVATLAITTPQTPDVLDSQTPPYTQGIYITGQQIVATAQYPDGMAGWTLVNALLQIGQTQTEIKNYVGNEAVTIPANVFTDAMTIVGIFARIDCTVHAYADASSASAGAVSGVSVMRYDRNINEWMDAGGTAKHGDDVRIYATVNTASGYELDGIYANGVKIASSLSSEGYVTHRVSGNTEFVVKAKVRISFSVGHWDVSGGAWIDDPENPCTVTARVGDTEVTAGGFDVVLGQSVSYAVNIEQGWHFDAWLAWDGETMPTSFDEPIDLPVEDAAFVPTKPLTLIARVTDEIVPYTTTVGFANNDNPASPVDIPQTDASNVVSYPTSDAAEAVSGKVELTYASGTKQVSLTFPEHIGTLFFEGLQEYVRTGFEQYEWVAAKIEGTVYSMLTSKTRTLRALYTTSGTRTVTVAYANITDGAGQAVAPGTESRVCGSIEIVKTEDTGTLSPDGKTYVADRGTPFTLRAIPLNGWRFVGWYYEPTHIGAPKYEGQEVSPPTGIISTRTLYAYFVPDTHAVYEWEGRADAKMMTWKSKVYVAQIPFNPSAIRVDATDSRGRGTSVASIEVGMMSSPDAAPAQSGLTVLQNMPNYVARRLPKRRPERYLYVEVQNDAEVDRIIVGTSMEGLRV